jgi:hypothetical protein
MPDKRIHRGAHPEDAALFGPESLPFLAKAAGDFCWLLSRGYAPRSSLQLVGDRYALLERQRVAVRRCCCSDRELAARRETMASMRDVSGGVFEIDGFNVLTTVEAALSRGVILVSRDGVYRDMASMHGSYRLVEETPIALELIGRTLAVCRPGRTVWYFDQPVSNSARLAQLVAEVATNHRWEWIVRLVPNPDGPLRRSDAVVCSADSGVLDAGVTWFNLAAETIDRQVPEPWLVAFADF